jgi:hypothetical protein
MRFLDTMSLHIMCSGFTHAQRIQYQAFEKGSISRSNDNDNIIVEEEEEDLDAQYLTMLLANEKDKDMKAYVKMRQMKVCSFCLKYGWVRIDEQLLYLNK